MTSAAALPGIRLDHDPARTRSVPTRATNPTREGWTHLVGAAGLGIDVSPDLDVESLVDRLAQALRESGSLERLDGDGLKDRVASLRRLAGLADAGMAAAVAALQASGTVTADGAPSPAAWLKANCNRSGRDAARTARLAEHIDELPATARALSDGRISAEAADAIVAATRDVELGEPHQVEADLAELASTVDPARLRRHIDRQRQAARGDTLLRDERRQHAVREASMSRDDTTGMWNLRAKLSDEAGTRIRTALDAFDIPTDDTKGRPHLRMADALDAMATAVLDHGHTPTSGGITRPHLAVTIDHATLSADLTDPTVPTPTRPTPPSTRRTHAGPTCLPAPPPGAAPCPPKPSGGCAATPPCHASSPPATRCQWTSDAPPAPGPAPNDAPSTCATEAAAAHPATDPSHGPRSTTSAGGATTGPPPSTTGLRCATTATTSSTTAAGPSHSTSNRRRHLDLTRGAGRRHPSTSTMTPPRDPTLTVGHSAMCRPWLVALLRHTPNSGKVAAAFHRRG